MRYKVNKQVILDGFIIGIGVFDESQIGDKGADFIKEYCDNQLSIPVSQRDVPPFFELENDNDEENEQYDQERYLGKTKKELIELCKQRGLKVNNKMTSEEIINILGEKDREEYKGEFSKFSFKSSDDFADLDSKDQVEYLEEVFYLPENIQDDSDDATEYVNKLLDTIKEYGGLSLDSVVVDKIKEIMNYINS